MKRDLTEVGRVNPYRHGSETVGVLNDKTLNYEIETSYSAAVNTAERLVLNDKTLNYEIET